MRLRQRLSYLASGTLIAFFLQCSIGGDLTTAVAAEPLHAPVVGKFAVSTTALKGTYNSDVHIYVTIIDTETGEIVLQREFDRRDYEGSARRW